ncbi:MAG: hydroxymethylbilane synthase [Nitrospinae bacterium]|jgi:hydroxymethylbilane synthase|nr:hydroxymethylbilane synthase [Nitrospinota bacterium]
MDLEKIIIGSRGSGLALWQANWIKSQLEELHPGLAVEIKIIKTSGDIIQDVPLAKIGGKGLFVKEIEEAMLRGEIDIAVHSMKDVPMNLPYELDISVITERENPFDALISRDNIKLDDLPENAKIGTGSLRRSSQLLKYRPDLQIFPLRGNIDTRIKKLESEGLDAIILAAAGLRRMGWADKITEVISPEIILPAMGQGAVGIEARKNDYEVLAAILDLDHEPTHLALDAERALVGELEGGCQVPIGAYATLDDDSDELTLKGLVSSLDGKTIYQKEKKGASFEAKKLGRETGKDLLRMGADIILKEIYQPSDPNS